LSGSLPTPDSSPPRWRVPFLRLAGGGETRGIQRNVAWQVGDRAARLVVGLVINVWVVRYLGATGVGLFGFSQSLVALSAIAAELGLESIVVRDLVRHPERAEETLGSAAGLRLGGAAVAFAIALAAVAFARPGDGVAAALVVVFASILFAQATDVVAAWFQSRADFRPFVLARGAAFVISAVVKVVCLVTRQPIQVIALAFAVEGWLAAPALLVAYRSAGGVVRRWRFHGARARQLAADAWPLALNSAALVLSTRADQVLLTLLKGEHENGIYAAAQRLSEILWYVPVAVAAAANPVLLRTHQEDRAVYERRLERLFRVLAWSALLMALPLSLAAAWIVQLLYGGEFARSATVFAIHVWSAPALFLGVAQTNWFIAEGRQVELMARSLVAALANVALNLVLIPRYGAVGSAAATLVAMVVAHLLVNAVVPHTRRLFVLQCRAFLPIRS
jgi:PST family polysaccharide transporter